MCDNLHLNSLKQCETPLNTLFFLSSTRIFFRGVFARPSRIRLASPSIIKTPMTSTVSCVSSSSTTLAIITPT